LTRILSEFADAGSWRSAARLCEVSTDVIGVSGAGIMLMSGNVPHGSVFASNELAALIEDLQYTLGEGPCVDAYHQDRVVLEPDLGDPAVLRWPAFAPQVLRAGVRAVFGFPLRVERARLGALNLFRDRPGRLSGDEQGDAVAMADVVARWVLDVQAGAPEGGVAAELEADADFHYVVQNAAGIVSVQSELSVTEAQVRIRAYAFSNSRPVGDVARDIVARTLRL
jgi:hypothetical protein